MGTFLVGIGVVCLIGFVIKSMIKDKKQGKSISCGCDCKHCKGHCH